jgi:COMPASS component SWD3
MDGRIYVYDLQKKVVRNVIEAHNDSVVSISVHPSMNMIASVSIEKDDWIKIWIGEDDK